MIDVRYARGLSLPQVGLWLDPREPRDLAFVSHAHSDHIGRHRESVLTAATARLMGARIGVGDGIQHVLEFRERLELRPGLEVMLIPAGHVLGSAQAWIRSDAGTLLYTGDFKLRRGASSEACEFEAAETLVMETTFGLPHYVFPPMDEVLARVVKFCVEAREDGVTPVLLGYSLGKAQEILAALETAGLPIMLHGAVWKMTEIYRSLGVRFPECTKYEAGAVRDEVVICPPGASGSAMLRKLGKVRVAALTGWAMDPGAIHRMRCDAVFPLSDHADYPDLIRHVEQVNPKRVLTLHGFAREFARDLRARGIEAWALTGADQLELAIDDRANRSASKVAVATLDLEGGFAEFCTLLDAVAGSTGKLAKVRLLADYLKKLTVEDLSRAATWLTGDAFAKAEARPLRVGWATLKRAVLSVSGLTPSELQSISRRHNDAGMTAREALVGSSGTANPTLGKVAEFFAALESARGPVAKGALLEQMLAMLPGGLAAGLVKILTGDLRIGLKAGLVEDAVAQAFDADARDVREAHMLLGDLGGTAVRAMQGRLDEIELTPFRPVGCMLASPEPDAVAVWERLGASGAVWLEDKLDGIRAQVHAVGERVEIYSRDLRPITDTFPEIAAAAAAPGRNFVLDGEILAWADGAPTGFAALQKRLGRKQEDLFMQAEIPVAFRAFDVLWADGKSCFRDPLESRRRILERLGLSGPVTPVPLEFARSAPEIDALFDAARARGNEGLIAKDPTSSYSPGRRGLAWIKLKKAFATLDVVVVAAEMGHGKRNGVLSDYTFAVNDGKGGLATIGKAYSGLTDAEILDLTAHFLGTTLRSDGRRFEVEPTVVLEIAFDAIQESQRHSSGLALRFPRIKAIRNDKSPDEIDTLASARKLLRMTKPSSTGHTLDDVAIHESHAKTRRDDR